MSLIKDSKPVEKQKARKESLSSYTCDSQPKCFSCGDHGHLKPNCSQLKEKALDASPYCFRHDMKGHRLKKRWTLYPKLKPIAKAASKSCQGQATTKNPPGKDKKF